jgi:hypothetical protein
MSLMPKIGFFRLFAMGLVLGPTFAAAQTRVISALVAKPVAMPENWGLADNLGFFALVVVIFAVLVQRQVLRPKKFQN